MIPRFYRNLELAQANMEAYAEQVNQKIFLAKRRVLQNRGEHYTEYRYITEKELKNCSTYQIIDECPYHTRDRAAKYLHKMLSFLEIKNYVPKWIMENPTEFHLYTKNGNVYSVEVKKIGTFKINE